MERTCSRPLRERTAVPLCHRAGRAGIGGTKQAQCSLYRLLQASGSLSPPQPRLRCTHPWAPLPQTPAQGTTGQHHRGQGHPGPAQHPCGERTVREAGPQREGSPHPPPTLAR